jgi:parvulin-like peptidyl-prolyl isomerase
MEQVRAKHILVESLSDAMDLYTKVKDNGEDFSALARTHSKCPSGGNGGDLGVFGRGQMVKPFEDATFALEVGGLSQPVQTQFGYHLIQRTS